MHARFLYTFPVNAITLASVWAATDCSPALARHKHITQTLLLLTSYRDPCQKNKAVNGVMYLGARPRKCATSQLEIVPKVWEQA